MDVRYSSELPDVGKLIYFQVYSIFSSLRHYHLLFTQTVMPIYTQRTDNCGTYFAFRKNNHALTFTAVSWFSSMFSIVSAYLY